MSMIACKLGRAALVLACLGLGVGVSAANEKLEARHKEVEERLKKDLFHLASDALEGRGPATEGLAKAGDYIAAEFKKAGLAPGAKNSYFQLFNIKGARLVDARGLTLKGPKDAVVDLKLGADYTPLGLSKSGAHKDVGVVFAGYGISSKDYDDYKGLDVAGKIVVVLRESPKDFKGPAKSVSLVEKLAVAEKADALAVLFVNSAAIAADGDDLFNFGFHATVAVDEANTLPAFQVKRGLVDKLLAGADTSLAKLEKAIDETKTPQSRALDGWTGSLELRVKRDGIDLSNVVGTLEGKGPLAKETVVIGAHYDHLGYGSFGSTSGQNKKMAIHNGADDNGSGTTALLELARRFGAMKEREGRRLVFIAFSGEEMGLLGSRHYCDKAPLYPLADTAFMLNLDMVGRMSQDKTTGQERVSVLGVGSSKGFSDLLDELNKKHTLGLKKEAGSRGDSDHWPFNQKKVPYLFFFSGMHPDYHKASDDADKINYVGMRRIVDLVEDILHRMAATPERPAYIEVKTTASGTRPGPGGIRLGITPGSYEEGEGLLIDAVSPMGIADKGGVKGGDVIVKMGETKIKGIEAYMSFMKEQKKGNTVEITVLRAKKELKLKLKLE